MKKEGHPNYHEVTVVMTDGSEFVTRSTYGQKGGRIELQIDPLSHPAWTGGGQRMLDQGGRLARFNKRFGGTPEGGNTVAPKAAPAAAKAGKK